MNKLLTIIVPAYNKEEYLKNCICSVVGTEWDRTLEIIIVNDGSTDSTLSVAKGLKAKYPETIVIIDKENGNYGSTINAALPIARGKYIRILDADDQFYKEGFCKLMTFLEQHDCDMCITNYAVVEGKEKLKNEIYPWTGTYNKVLPLEKVLSVIAESEDETPIFMHNLTYRTSILQKNGYHQTEGVSYTDTEWTFYPLFYVNTVVFTDIIVYKYFLGIPGQTMAPDNYIKGTPQLLPLVIKMQQYYTHMVHTGNISPAFHAYVTWHLFKGWYLRIFKVSLLFLDNESYDYNKIRLADASLRTLDATLSKFVAGRCKERHVKYMKYWRLVHRRLPLWLRKYLISHTEIP